MTEKIDTILYLPTLRCNLNCKHCGEEQDIRKEQEVDGDLILERLQESILVRTKLISVTGGEPFLNASFPRFVLRLLRETNLMIEITSNGYFYDVIEGLAASIRDENKDRVKFNISIDGIEKTHDAIRRHAGSYSRAVKAVSSLREYGISCSINSVVQDSNLHELDEMHQTLKKLFPGIGIGFIPMAIDISEDTSYEYTGDYQKEIWRYLVGSLAKKKVLAKGYYGISRCNAGKRNITIGPGGEVYACLTGAFYKSKERRESYLLGDLKKNTLDEIFLSEKADNVRDITVKQCEGCTNPCEIFREVDYYGMDYSLSANEVIQAFDLEKTDGGLNRLLFGDGLLDFDSWYGVEQENNGRGGGYDAGAGVAAYKAGYAPAYLSRHRLRLKR